MMSVQNVIDNVIPIIAREILDLIIFLYIKNWDKHIVILQENFTTYVHFHCRLILISV